MSLRRAFLVGAALLAAPATLHAQNANPGWFVPSQSAPRAAAPRPAHRRVQQPGPVAGPAIDPAAVRALQAQQSAPIPTLPPLTKGTTPPAAIIGVIGVPNVLQASIAAQAVDKEIQKRRAALAADAQKEQDTWRHMQAALADPKAHLSPDQLRSREQALQQRIADAQTTFRNREARIQAAAQVSLGQIERTLIAVIRQVATSRGMNLVLHRAQVALNMNAFDISDEVTAQLNKVMPSVVVQPDAVFANVTAAMMQQQQAEQGQ
jgi:Skp family chaperone for outer membrane proteins